MQNQIIKQDILDNSLDSFVIINPTKQQIAFFPKEESQMFTSKEPEFTGTRPSGYVNDPATETENKDTVAFIQRAKFNSDETIDYDTNYGAVPGDATALSLEYKYNLNNINSSHTETDYIGATTYDVVTNINETFATFNLYNLSTDTITSLYADTDTAAKIKKLLTGMQGLRIPQNALNTILTDETAIIANNNSPIVKNLGLYYAIVSPTYVKSTISNIIARKQYDWLNMPVNGTLTYDLPDNLLEITPDSQRRTVYECNKTDFQNLIWNFETSGLQSGRLYGSVVEIWDASETTLKQIKVITENEFNFSTMGSQAHFALYPDNVGYDAPDQRIAVGDVIHIYPRETYFNQFMVELNYKDGNLSIENLLSFMMNDAVRDVTTGVYQIYDSTGFTIDSSGNVNGNVLLRYQLFNTGRYEARKIIKNS